jgi:hypothetical protein
MHVLALLIRLQAVLSFLASVSICLSQDGVSFIDIPRNLVQEVPVTELLL